MRETDVMCDPALPLILGQHLTWQNTLIITMVGLSSVGPRWERYGRTPDDPIEEGNVVTLEIGVENVDGRGFLGLEEIVLVTSESAIWLSNPQKNMRLLNHESAGPTLD